MVCYNSNSGFSKNVILRWRPYSPEVTQLLERAHNKKLNRIYLKVDATRVPILFISIATFLKFKYDSHPLILEIMKNFRGWSIFIFWIKLFHNLSLLLLE